MSFVLENTVFLLIGLQTKWLLEDVGSSDLSLGRIALVCLTALLGVIVLRLVWVFPVRFLLVRPHVDREIGRRPPLSYTFLIGWAGMRGVVTLAAAFVIPEGTEHREVLLLVALTVVAGTLLIQGLSLPWLARRLKVPAPDPLEDALARASLLQQTSKAAFERLEDIEHDDRTGVLDSIRHRVEQRNFAAWERLNTTADVESPSDLYTRVRLTMIEAEREKVLEVRSTGTVPSEVVAEVLGMLDVEESMLDEIRETRDVEREAAFSGAGQDSCAHLEQAPPVATRNDLACDDCEPDER